MKNLNVRNLLKIAVLTLFMVVNIGCPDKKRRTTVTAPRTGPPGSGNAQQDERDKEVVTKGTQTSLGLCDLVGDMPGIMYRQDSNDNAFGDDIYSFLSAWANPGFVDGGLGLGDVGSDCSDTTGVRFTGVAEANAVGASQTNSFNITGGDILIGIYDSTFLSEDGEPIIIYGTHEWGAVDGNYARIIYNWGERDESGKITTLYGDIILEGEFVDSNTGISVFAGEVWIENDRDFEDGVTPSKGKLADFAIPTCKFFNNCQ